MDFPLPDHAFSQADVAGDADGSQNGIGTDSGRSAVLMGTGAGGSDEDGGEDWISRRGGAPMIVGAPLFLVRRA